MARRMLLILLIVFAVSYMDRQLLAILASARPAPVRPRTRSSRISTGSNDAAPPWRSSLSDRTLAYPAQK
jgi:hypothetical protein